MSKEWFTTADLAGLPELPDTERGIRFRGKGWKTREVPAACRGGRRYEYHISSLPEAARIELAKRLVGSAPVATSEASKAGAAAGHKLREEAAVKAERERIAKERGLAQYHSLPPARRAEADAIFAVLKARDAYLAASRLPHRRGTEQFCALLSSGSLPLSADVVAPLMRNGRLAVSRSSLDRWEAAYREGGLASLARKYSPSKEPKSITHAQREFIIAMIAQFPHARVQAIVQGVEARFGTSIGYSAVRRFVVHWKEEHASLLLRLTNPDAWRSAHMFGVGRADEVVTRLNQVWEMDSSPADMLLADGQRYTLLGLIDVYSRRLKFLVKPTSNAVGIAALIRRGIVAWGVPEAIRKDNGKDYTADHITRVEEALGIEPVLCEPFSPWQKPHIERAFGTFCRDLVELMPGYIGHSVAERKSIESRTSFANRMMKRGESVELRLTADELQRFCDRWVDSRYEQRSHEGLEDRTPAEVAREWPEAVRRIEDERALDALLAPAAGHGGYRVIGKEGVEADRRTYAALEMIGHEGESVLVLLDPTDVGRVYVYRANGEFLCVAVDPTAPEVNRAEFAAHLKARQKAIYTEGTKALKAAAKALKVEGIGEEILAAAEAKMANVVELPKASTPYTTDALREAARAVEAREECDRGASPEWLLSGNDFTSGPTLEEPEPAEVVPFFSSDVEVYEYFRKLRERRPLTEDEVARVRTAWKESKMVRQLAAEDQSDWAVGE